MYSTDVYTYLNNALVFYGNPVNDGRFLYLSPVVSYITSIFFKMGYYDDSVVDAKNKEQINKLLNTSQDDAYKLLLVSYCNFLNKQLPFMFERINDYTELLMPDDLLSTNSVLSQTVAVLDKETCKDVEVIGWLYQYYITDLNELVYDGNMSKKRISKELLPAATLLFTPKWAVHQDTY